jgi:uncharacterized protein (DUF111 family)
MSRVAIVDSQVAGIAGDMLMSSLVDAGANKTKVIEAIFTCQNFIKDSRIIDAHFAKVISHGFAATQLQMKCKDGVLKRKGTEMHLQLARCCDSVGLEDRAKTFALGSLKMIISAEAAIHGQDFEIFKNKQFVLVGGQAEDELTTPTGAAMLVNLVHGSVNYYPSIAPEKIGYGAGIKKFEGFPNVVRVAIGTSGTVYETVKDTVYLVETNIDDVSGELVGNLVEQLAEVAKDVTVISGTTKKSRPTCLIRIISENAQLNSVLKLLFDESGTLGARVQEVERIVLPRSILTMSVNINGNILDVRVKIVKDSTGRLTNVKPEFEDVKMIATKCQIPVKSAMDQVRSEVMKKLGEA